MNKIEFTNIDVDLYKEKLSNGMEVYIAPKMDVNNIYVTFSTKYGSINSEFIPINENEMIKVPDGVAHFLEHKMFEQKDGIDPFTFYSDRGADANANTSAFKTTYLFSGPDFFEENLNYLIDYVQSPYFTDKNVEKEKGIIEQEIKMYQDDPYSRMYEGLLFNSFSYHPIRKSVIGTVETINSITKEVLYKCYNTFYHPSNMFIVITGNVDPEKTFEIIKENQLTKQFKNAKKIVTKAYEEPDQVYKQKEIIKLNVSTPKVAINFKFNLSKFKDMELKDIVRYITLIFDINFGTTSLFNEKLKKEDLINNNLEISNVLMDTHILFTIFAETQNFDRLTDLILNQTKNFELTEEQLERKKKATISYQVLMSDNIHSMNHKIMNNIITYKEVLTDSYNEIRSLNIKDAKKILKNMNFDNYSIFIVDKK